MQINYNDSSLLSDEDKVTPNELIKTLRLTEQVVDNDYKINYLNDTDKLILERLREHYGDQGYYPISYQQLRRVIFSIYKNIYDSKLHNADLVRICRMYWRAGEFRRYYAGKIYKHKPSKVTGRDHAYGIHYLLYPKHRGLDDVKLTEVTWEAVIYDYNRYQRDYRARKKEEARLKKE